MRRMILGLSLVLACTAPAADAQQLLESRFHGADVGRPVVPVTVHLAVALDDRPPAPVKGQFLAGIGGFFGGALAVGIASGAVGYVASGGEQKNMRGAFAYGAIAGALAGPTVGVHWYGRRHGLRSSVLSTAIGSAIGLLPVPLAPITMPLGATIGYNRARQARSDTPP